MSNRNVCNFYKKMTAWEFCIYILNSIRGKTTIDKITYFKYRFGLVRYLQDIVYSNNNIQYLPDNIEEGYEDYCKYVRPVNKEKYLKIIQSQVSQVLAMVDELKVED